MDLNNMDKSCTPINVMFETDLKKTEWGSVKNFVSPRKLRLWLCSKLHTNVLSILSISYN